MEHRRGPATLQTFNELLPDPFGHEAVDLLALDHGLTQTKGLWRHPKVWPAGRKSCKPNEPHRVF